MCVPFVRGKETEECRNTHTHTFTQHTRITLGACKRVCVQSVAVYVQEANE